MNTHIRPSSLRIKTPAWSGKFCPFHKSECNVSACGCVLICLEQSPTFHLKERPEPAIISALLSARGLSGPDWCPEEGNHAKKQKVHLRHGEVSRMRRDPLQVCTRSEFLYMPGVQS